MNKQRQVVLILLILFLGQTQSLVTWATPGNARILESTEMNAKSENSNPEKINKIPEKTKPRKLSQKKSKYTKEEIAREKTSQYLTLAMSALLVYNDIDSNKGIQKNRKMRQLKKHSLKMANAMKGKSLTDFLTQQNKKLDTFWVKRQRKLQEGSGAMASVVKLGEQYIANQFGIPASLMGLITPMAGTLIRSLVGGTNKEEGLKNFKIDKGGKRLDKKRTHKRRASRVEDEDELRKI